MHLKKEEFEILIFYSVRGILSTKKGIDDEIVKHIGLRTLDPSWYKILNLYYISLKNDIKKDL